MGLCLSHCGEAQHKAAVVAVSISHQSSASPARPSRSDAQGDAGQSLKRFLHLYMEGSEGRKLSSASPRASLDDSLAIPHSSELFSLPSEGGSESDRSRSPSPARGSAARSSASSRPPASPSGRKSVGVRSFSSEKPPRVSNAKKVLESCSANRQVTEPHKNLVETIARLEKFCDVKLFLEKRSSVRRNSSHELSATCALESSILLHNSCRDLALKLLCFSNEHAHRDGDGALSRSVRRCDSAKEMKSDLQDVKECLPFEKSVASFLEEVENFVSEVDASAPQRPVERVTEGERDESVSRLPSLRFQDADEKVQFTDFEATFESPCSGPSGTSPSDRSLETDQPSTQGTRDRQARPSVSVECETKNSALVALHRPAHRHSRTTSDFGGMYHIDGTTEEKMSMPRFALTEIDFNVRPAHDPLARKDSPLKVSIPMGRKRGVTRPLDSQDISIPQLPFGALKRQQAHNSTEVATWSGEESHCSKAMDSATIERLAHEGGGEAAPPSPDAAPSQPQPTEGRSSVDREPIDQESVGTGDANAGGEISDLQGTDARLLDKDSEKSLSMAFDNLLKLLQSPTAELAQNTSALLELLGAQSSGANTEFSADGSHVSKQGIVPKTQADALSQCEAESWHDAPASLSTTEQPELHSFTQ